MDPVAVLARLSEAVSDGDIDATRDALDAWRSWRALKGWTPEGYSAIVNRARRFIAEHEHPEYQSMWQSPLFRR